MTYKKSLLILCLCTCVFPHTFAMDTNAKCMKEFEEAIKGKGSKNTAQLRSLVATLSQYPQYYRKIAILTHPDKTNDDKELAELFKAAQECYSKTNRATVITANDINNVKSETEKSKEFFDNIQRYSISTATLATTLQQGQQELSHNFIDNIIGTTFILISDKLITRHPENTDIRQYASSLHDDISMLQHSQDSIKSSLKMHTDYRADLQSLKNKTDQAIQEQLKKCINKGRK